MDIGDDCRHGILHSQPWIPDYKGKLVILHISLYPSKAKENIHMLHNTHARVDECTNS